MKTKNLVLFVAIVCFCGFLGSCEKTDVAENEALYEVHGVDRTKVERPGEQGGN